MGRPKGARTEFDELVDFFVADTKKFFSQKEQNRFWRGIVGNQTPQERVQLKAAVEQFNASGNSEYMREIARSNYNVYRKFAKLFKAPVQTFIAVLYEGEELFQISAKFKKWIQDNAQIKDIIGRMLAGFVKNKFAKYGLNFTIDNFNDPLIIQKLDEFFCNTVNDKVSERMRREVVVLSSLIPSQDIPLQIDAFVTRELNLLLDTNFKQVIIRDNGAQAIDRDFVINALMQPLKNEIRTRLVAMGGSGNAIEKALIDRIVRNVLDYRSGRSLILAGSRDQKNKIKNRVKAAKHRETNKRFAFDFIDGESDALVKQFRLQFVQKKKALLDAKKRALAATNAYIRYKRVNYEAIFLQEPAALAEVARLNGEARDLGAAVKDFYF